MENKIHSNEDVIAMLDDMEQGWGKTSKSFRTEIEDIKKKYNLIEKPLNNTGYIEHENGSIAKIQDTSIAFGINENKRLCSWCYGPGMNGWKPVTVEKWQAAMLDFAKKKFVVGGYYKSLKTGDTYETQEDDYFRFDEDKIRLDGALIFQEGIWADTFKLVKN